MAEDSDLERTEPASAKRIEQAREKGQIARSRELTTFAVLMAGVGTLTLMGGTLYDRMTGIVRSGLSISRSEAFDQAAMFARLHQEAMDMLLAFAPFFLVLFIAAVASSMALSGWLFTFQALQPDFARLDPFKGITRVFSAGGFVELAKASLKSALIGGVSAWVIWHNLDAILLLLSGSFESGVGEIAHLVGQTLMIVVGSMALIVAIDIPYQLWEHGRKLRMTKEELRQEAKELEGDPQIKARIRSMQREAARRRMMQEVPKADVIVTNPTHYAVALRYQGNSMRAPQVVAKGAHLLAERICELGLEHRVPILRTPPLARALYRHGELGMEIPAALYTAVAEVLAYIYQLQRYEKDGGPQPSLPDDLPVPPGLDPEAAKA